MSATPPATVPSPLKFMLPRRAAVPRFPVGDVRKKAYWQNALAIIDRFEILFAAWQTFATASQVYKYAKEVKTAEAYRGRAESCILKIADSFEPNEPLRATFLAATPVRRILCERAVYKAKRRGGSRRLERTQCALQLLSPQVTQGSKR
jgi:hypothetical protein